MLRGLRSSTFYAGLASLALGGLMVGSSWGTRFFVPGFGPSAMAFPMVVGWCALAVGVLLTGRSLLGLDRSEPPSWPERAGGLRLLGLIVSLLAYVALLDRLGFLLANLLLGLAVLVQLGRYRWWVVVGLSVAVAVLATLIFRTLLGVSLPRGPLSDLPLGGL